MVWTMAIVVVGAGFAIAALSYDQSQTQISETKPESRGGVFQQSIGIVPESQIRIERLSLDIWISDKSKSGTDDRVDVWLGKNKWMKDSLNTQGERLQKGTKHTAEFSKPGVFLPQSVDMIMIRTGENAICIDKIELKGDGEAMFSYSFKNKEGDCKRIQRNTVLFDREEIRASDKWQSYITSHAPPPQSPLVTPDVKPSTQGAPTASPQSPLVTDIPQQEFLRMPPDVKPSTQGAPTASPQSSQSPLVTDIPQQEFLGVPPNISIEFDKASYRMSDKAEITMTFPDKQQTTFLRWDKDKVDKINVDLSLTSIGYTTPILLTESGIDTGVFKTSFCRDQFGLSPLKVSHPTYPDSVATADIKPLRSSDSDDYIKFKKESNIRAIETVGWVITSKDDSLELTRFSRTGDQPIDFYDIKIKNCGKSTTYDMGKTPPMWAFTGFNGGYVTVTLDYDYEVRARPPVIRAFQADNELRIDYRVDSLEIPNSNIDTSGDKSLKIFEDTDPAYAALLFGDIRDYDSVSPSKKFVVSLYDPSLDHGFWHEVLEFGVQAVTDTVLSMMGDAFGIPLSEIIVLGTDCDPGQSAGACLREYADEQDVLAIVTSEKNQIPHAIVLKISDNSDKRYTSNPIRASDITTISGDKIIIFYKSMSSALKIN